MTATYQTSTSKAWAKAITSPGKEFSLTPLTVLAGTIPEGLKGSLYRNGPALLKRGKTQVGHWFDGDGAILAVHFADRDATAVYRYVQTEGYQQESVADNFLYPNYGMTVPGQFWRSWGKKIKNSANTSVLALDDRLLALWEAGLPHALDLQTLETKGLDNLGNSTEKSPFSAHPKIDPHTGDIFNFGVTLGLNSILNIYRCDRRGKVLNKGTASLSGLPIVHDFVMAGQYLIFFVPPVKGNLITAGLGLASFSDSMEWKPELGTEILVFDRDTLSLVSRCQVDPWYQWHFSNGYVDRNGLVTIEFVRFPDFQTNQNLKEVATGKINTPATGTLWQISLDPKTAKISESRQLADRGCEFPIVANDRVGQSWRYTYLAAHKDGIDTTQEIFGAIACFDRDTEELVVADMGENCYASEPIYVADRSASDLGWLLTVVYDGNIDRSEVRIYRSDLLDETPVCRLSLPSVIPPGFHGTWASNK